MTSMTSASRVSWADRWTKPSLESLIESLKAHHRRQFVHLMEKLDAVPGMDKTILWYGPSWKWTIAYNLKPVNGNGNGHGATTGRNGKRGKAVQTAAQPAQPSDVFCFLVPSVENPSVCIPLAEHHAEVIASGTLSRYLREGINTAKCAVATRWATWTPATESESTQLTELLKKKLQLVTEQGW